MLVIDADECRRPRSDLVERPSHFKPWCLTVAHKDAIAAPQRRCSREARTPAAERAGPGNCALPDCRFAAPRLKRHPARLARNFNNGGYRRTCGPQSSTLRYVH